MDDKDVLQRIHDLVDEEHRLERSHADDEASDSDRTRLRQIEVALDQCWDLLRQRRARRDFGLDTDDATVRPASIVEHYQQ
jgi:hypothetical protein